MSMQCLGEKEIFQKMKRKGLACFATAKINRGRKPRFCRIEGKEKKAREKKGRPGREGESSSWERKRQTEIWDHLESEHIKLRME